MATKRNGKRLALPSDAELKILRDLWVHGESSVREIHDRVGGQWPIGYTTVLKLLQRMLEKGLVSRRRVGRAHRYLATAAEAKTQRRMARDVVQRMFGGSITDFIAAALPTGRARAKELKKLRRELKKMP